MTRETALQLFLDGKGFVFDTGYIFRGLTISENGGGFNCVLRAWTRTNQAVYAMTTADDPQEGINKLYEALSHGNGDTLWRPDKFASPRGGK